jgi:hypothetical protein
VFLMLRSRFAAVKYIFIKKMSRSRKDTPWKEHQGLHRWRCASGMALGRHAAARLHGPV